MSFSASAHCELTLPLAGGTAPGAMHLPTAPMESAPMGCESVGSPSQTPEVTSRNKTSRRYAGDMSAGGTEGLIKAFVSEKWERKEMAPVVLGRLFFPSSISHPRRELQQSTPLTPILL